MALLLRPPPPSLPVRLMAARLFSYPSLKFHHSLSPPSLSRLFLNTRSSSLSLSLLVFMVFFLLVWVWLRYRFEISIYHSKKEVVERSIFYFYSFEESVLLLSGRAFELAERWWGTPQKMRGFWEHSCHPPLPRRLSRESPAPQPTVLSRSRYINACNFVIEMDGPN